MKLPHKRTSHTISVDEEAALKSSLNELSGAGILTLDELDTHETYYQYVRDYKQGFDTGFKAGTHFGYEQAVRDVVKYLNGLGISTKTLRQHHPELNEVCDA